MLNQEFKNESITSIIRKRALQDKVALICDDGQLTYSDLLALVDTYAGKLHFLGVKRHTKVVTLLSNGLAMTAIMLAIADIGATLVPLNPEYKNSQVLQAIQSSAAEFIIHEQDLLLQHTTNKIDLRHFEHVPYQEYTPSGRAEDMYILTMTSGSTGNPKPIIFSQQTKITRAFGAQQLYGLSVQDTILCATPQYHSLAQRLTLLPLLMGATCYLLKGFSPQSWLNAIEQGQVTFTIAVSSQLVSVLPFLAKHDHAIKSLKRIVSSSSPIEKEYKEQLIELLSCPIHECYGASEVGTVSDFDASCERYKIASVGRIVPQAEVVIRDSNAKPMNKNEVGEITVKSSTAFLGYFDKPELTELAVKEGYFYTGDLGSIDEDGFLYFRGRKKDIIISGGINIYPEDIETVVNNFHGVKESVVFAVNSPRLGEVAAVAFVSESQIKSKEIRKWCTQHLAAHQVPLFFIKVDELPKTGLGKVKRNECKQKYATELEAKAALLL